MFCLAVCELGGALTASEEAAIAEILGVAAYDVRIKFAGVLPRIAAQGDSVDAMVALAERLRQRGHGAIVFSAADAVPLERMTPLRRFVVDQNRLYANDHREPSRPLADLAVIAHVVLDVRVQRTTRELVHGGTRSQGEVQDKLTAEKSLDEIVVLFWREGGPWRIRPVEAHYLGLGKLAPTMRENFRSTIALLRARTTAAFDDRFVAHRLVAGRAIDVREHEPAHALASDRGVETTIHALGSWLARDRSGPYR